MQSFLLEPKTKETFLERIQSLKFSTKENYQSSLNQFEKFSNEYYKRNSNQVINELKSLHIPEKDEAYFTVLQNYVNWLIKKNLSASTVNLYFQVITYYFSHFGIRVHQMDIKQKIKRPRKIKEKLHSLKREEILKLFEFSPRFRIMLYLTLIGSGMRIQEAVSLRRKDFALDKKRIQIEIPAIHTKAQTSHTTFVTKEAEIFLKPHLEKLGMNELVFATNQNPFHAKMTEIEAFARYRKKANLTECYQSTNRHHFTLHSFRSYFFTRARRIHDTDIAHAMVGHTTYLDMYDRKEDEERLELFLKVEPELKVFGNFQ